MAKIHAWGDMLRNDKYYFYVYGEYAQKPN